MIRKPNRSGARRLTAGVLVAGVVAAGAVALASPAGAANSSLNSLTIAPTTSTSGLSTNGNAGNCVKYVVSGQDVDGSNDSGSAFVVQLTNSAGNASTDGGFCAGGRNGIFTSGSQSTGVTATNGSVFYVGSSAVGTINITAYAGTSPNAPGAITSNTVSLKTVNNVNDAVKTLTVTPSDAKVSAGQPATFTLMTLDAGGNPVANAVVSRNNANTAACNGATDSSGKTTCTVPGSETATSSSQTFYVNQSTGGSGGPDSTEPQATATVTVVQEKNVSSLTLTCVDQTRPSNGSNSNNNTTCSAPLSGSATIKALARDSSGNPIQGAVVNFMSQGANASNGGNFSSPQAVTDANGVATTMLSASQPSGNATETDTVSAETLNGTQDGPITINFEAPVASALEVEPGDQSAMTGGTVTENVQIDDQFGQPYTKNNGGTTVTYNVTAGRNFGTNGTVNTGSNGSATISYTDKGTNSTATTDTLQISNSSNYPVTNNHNSTHSGTINNGNTNVGTFTITYVSSATVSTVALNFVQTPSTNPACTTNRADPNSTTTNSGSPNDEAQEICVLVTNSNNQTLGGKSVTFTVSQGSVGDDSVVSDTPSTTYTTNTNANGVAVAYVTSRTAGAQTIQAAVGTVTSNSLTDTYSSGNPVYTLTSSPPTATVQAGKSQTFTVLATDQAGQPVSNEEIVVQQQGPGSVNQSFVVTSSNGTASVQLNTMSSDSGAGSVTFEDNFGFFNGSCRTADGGTCTATSTYTVTPGSGTGTVSSISVAANQTKPVLQTSSVTATAKDSAGNPVSGATLNFAGTGANTPSGSAVTGTDGTATFSFKPYHAGATKITATSGSATPGSVTVTIPKGEVTNKESQATPFSGRVRMFDYPSVGGAGVQVNFYQVISPTRNKYLGTARTDSNGRAYFQAGGLKSGSSFKGVARSFYNTANFNNRYSNEVTTRVK